MIEIVSSDWVLMGSRIVKRLLDAGYSVTGYNRTRSKASSLIDSGLKWCNTPREVARTADIIFSMVSDTAALDAITGGPDGILSGLSAGKIYIDMSTVSPNFSRDLAKKVEVIDAFMLEAPNITICGIARSGRKSIIAPKPKKINSGKSSVVIPAL